MPTVTLAAFDKNLITEAELGQTVELTLTFSVAMDPSVFPLITLSGGAELVLTAPDTSNAGLGWITGGAEVLEYKVRYTIAGDEVELSDIVVEVSGAQDDAGNPMAGSQFVSTQTEIDTIAPASESETKTIDEIPDQDVAPTGTPVELASLSGTDGTTYVLDGSGGVYEHVQISADVSGDYRLEIKDDPAARGYFDAEENPTINIGVIGTDDAGNQTTSVIELTLADLNDAPQFGAGLLADTISERADGAGENALPFGVSGSYGVTDDDLSDTHSVSVTNISATRTIDGTSSPAPFLGLFLAGLDNPLTGDGQGTIGWNWSVGSPLPASAQASQIATIDALAVGETIVQEYDVTISDGNGGVLTERVVVTIEGTNDAPVISGAAISDSVTEAADDGGNQALAATGTLTVSDTDTSDTVSVGVTSVTVDGASAYSGTAPDNTILLAMMSVVAGDGSGGTPSSATGDMDADVPAGSEFTWEFTAGTAGSTPFDFLGAGETLLLNYTLTATDSSGAGDAFATQVVTITVNGTNDVPDIVANTVEDTILVEAGVGPANAPTVGTDEATGNLSDGSNWSDSDAGETTDLEVVSAELSGGTTTSIAGTGETAVAGQYGTLYLSADGFYRYELDNDRTESQALFDGETVTEVFDYTIANRGGGDGNEASAQLTISITGENDAPVIAVDTGAPIDNTVTEQGATETGDATASGSFVAPDADSDAPSTADDEQIWSITAVNGAGITHEVANGAAAEATGTYGSLSLDSAGQWTYSLNDADQDTDMLTEGASVTDVFTVRVADGLGGFTEQDVTVTVTGSNDAPTITTASTVSGVVEAGGIDNADTGIDEVSGDLSVGGNWTDIDTGEAAGLSVVSANLSGNSATAIAAAGETVVAGMFGNLHLSADGSYRYVLDNTLEKTQALDANDEATEVFSYTIANNGGGAGNEASSTLTVNITGANDNPVITAGTDEGSVIEAGVDESNGPAAGTPTVGGMLAADDVDDEDGASGTALTWSLVAESGQSGGGTSPVESVYGDFSVNQSGEWEFILNNLSDEVQSLHEGQVVTETFKVQVTDGESATDTHDVTVTITGANDAPTLGIFEQGFETDTDGIFDGGAYGIVTRVANGTNGISAPDGLWFALVDEAGGSGPFTRFDGYRDTFTDGLSTEVKVYLDTSWAAGSGFGYSVAANGADGSHERDFIFHVTQDTSSGKLLIGVSNNSNSAPREDLETGNNTEITQSGWYTLQHVFREDGGVLAVDLNVIADDGTVLFTETLSDPADTIGVVVGGNRYGWFTDITIPGGLAIDSVTLGKVEGAVTELDDNAAGEGTETLSAVGVIPFEDVDLTDTHSVTVTEDGTGYLGSLTAVVVDTATTDQRGTVRWSFEVSDGVIDYLAADEQLTQTYTLRVSDNNDGFAEETVTVTISGTNDAPTITAGSTDGAGIVTEEDADPTLTDNGTITFEDVDLTDTHGTTVTAGAGNTLGGTLTAGTITQDANTSAGSFGWTYEVANSAVQYLSAGQQVTETFTVSIDDGEGGTVDQAVVVTVTGTNDRPTIEVESGDSIAETIVESSAATLSTAGTLSIADTDTQDTHAVTASYSSANWTDLNGADNSGTASQVSPLPTDLETALMSALTAQINGSDARQIDWSFSLDDTLADFLGAGETLTVVYDISTNDGGGFDGSGVDEDSESVSQEVRITITGTNEAPVVTADALNHFDEGDSIEVVDSVLVGSANPSLVTVNLLGDGTDTASEIWVTNLQDEDQNDTRAITGATSVSVQAGSTLNGFSATDVMDAFDLSGAAGAAGAVSFNRNAAVFDALDDGEWIDVQISYQVTTTSPDGTTPDVDDLTTTIRVDGVNDAPYITEGDGLTTGVVELDDNASGEATNAISVGDTIEFSDVDVNDIDTANLSVTVTPISGDTALGDYVGGISAGFIAPAGGADGTVFYTFTVNDGVLDNLSATDSFVQLYKVSITDGDLTIERPIEITIQGTNDAPIITATTGDSILVEDGGTVESDSAATQQLTGTITFDDVDISDLPASGADGADTHAVTAVFSTAVIGATDASAHLEAAYTGTPTALTFDTDSAGLANDTSTVDNTANWSFQITDGDFDFLAGGETLEITYTVTVADNNSGTVTQDITFSITGTNDAPVLAALPGVTLTDTAAPDTFADVTGTAISSDVDNGSSAIYSITGQVASAEAGFDQQVSNAFGTLYLNETSGVYKFVANAAAVNALTASQDINFDVVVTDAHAASDTQTLTITLEGANDAPVLGAIANGTIADTSADDTYADVTGSFAATDIDDMSTATFSVDAQVADSSELGYDHSVAHALGTLYLNETTGDYKFVADDAAVEALSADTTISFAVTVTDDASATDTGTLTIDVTAVNDNPRGAPDVALADGTEDTAYTVSEADLLSGFTDAEGGTLSVGTIAADNGATVVADGMGGFTVTPVADFNGTITLTYSVVDGNSGEIAGQTQTFHLNATADPDMIAGNATLDASVTDQVEGDWIIGDGIPVDGWAVATDGVDAPGLEIGLNAPLRLTGERYIDLDQDPNGQTYVVPDGSADGTPQGDVTTGNADDNYARWNFQISIAANTDGSGGTIGDSDFTFRLEEIGGSSFTPVEFTSAQFAAALNLDNPGSGDAFLASETFTVSWNFAMNFLGLTGFNPEAPGTYRVSVTADDPDAGTPILANHIDIIVNEAPVAVDDTVIATEDTPVTFLAADLLGNDTDGNGDSLEIQSVTAVSGGTAVLNGDGSVTFTPDENFNGNASFTYVATDGQMVNDLSGTGTVTVNVSAVNDEPENTLAPSYETDEDTSLPLTGLSVSDVDAASGTITVELSVDSGTLAALSTTGVSVSNSSTGAIQLSGTVADINAFLASPITQPIFTPAADVNGDVTLTMTSNDGGNSGSGGNLTDIDTVTITVNPVNDAPVANTVPAGTFPTVDEDEGFTGTVVSGTSSGPTEIPLSTFATDVDGNIDPSSLSFVSATIDGVVATLADAGITYVPGDGSFTFDGSVEAYQPLDEDDEIHVVVNFSVTDTESDSDSGSVTFTVRGTNDDPVVEDLNIGTVSDTAADDALDTPLTGTLTSTDDDASSIASYAVIGSGVVTGNDGADYSELNGTYGTLRVYVDGNYTYAVNAAAVNAQPEGSNIDEDFSVEVSDGLGGSDTATLTVTIDPANDTPDLAPVGDLSFTDTAASNDFGAQGGTLSATDRDTGHAVAIEYTIDGETPQDGETTLTYYWDRDANGGTGAVSTSEPANGVTLGTLTVQTVGGYSFEPNDAGINALQLSEDPIINTVLRATDPQGASVTTTLAINIAGENDDPVVVGSGTIELTAKEQGEGNEGALIDVSDTIAFSDVDSDNTPSFGFNPQGSGYQGTIFFIPSGGTVADGSVGVRFQINDSTLNSLAEGQALSTSPQSYEITISDGDGGSVTQNITVNIVGTNDRPVIAGALGGGMEDTAALNEAPDGALDATLRASGTLSVSDEDTTDDVVISVAGAQLSGGSFSGTSPLSDAQLQAMMQVAAGSAASSGFGNSATLSADGAGSDFTWQFTSGSAGASSFDFLSEDETLEVTYSLEADDKSATGTATQSKSVTITITGTNDAPVVDAALADQSSDEDTAFSFTVPAGTFSDVDG
ncbi:VCBS domain-containing protein, partial [Lutimaribacter marinistellae]